MRRGGLHTGGETITGRDAFGVATDYIASLET
jgi:hypothetical protein